MPTPERRNDRHSLSRRSPEQQQQQQQQQSPFRRARRDIRLSDYNNFEPSKIPSPSTRDSPRHRSRTFSQTQTLRGAFEATSRVPRMSGETTSYARGTLSPQQRRQSSIGMSPMSNPPNELRDIYRRIDDAHSLADLEPEEDLQIQDMRDLYPSGSELRAASGVGSSRDIFAAADADFLNEVQDETLRSTLAEHIMDEHRLKRATSNQSPVLSRDIAGSQPSLTAENLQRREEEIQNLPEEDDYFNPSMNLPSAWGSRGTHRRNWMRDLGRRTEIEPRRQRDDTTTASALKSRSGTVERSPGRTNLGSRSALGERSRSGYNQVVPAEEQNTLSLEQENQQEGNAIPNTPILVYKNSTFNKRSPTKRDSHSLLRKLSRAESPNQIQTPEAQKHTGNRIYDKTPVVTGAWIDTPMTERATILPTVEAPINTEPEKHPQQMETPPPEPQQTEPQSVDFQPSEPQSDAAPRSETHLKKAKQKSKSPLAKPDLPKSGLDSIMKNVRSDKDSYEFGDDTIESLQMILDEQPTESNNDAENDAAYEEAILKKLEAATAEAERIANAEGIETANVEGNNGIDRDVLNNEELFDRLNDKLKSLVENINTARKGLSGLEEQVARDNDLLSSGSKPSKGLRHPHTGENCETCGVHSDGRLYTSIRLPRLWKRDPVSRRIRPTLLGWSTAISLVWFYSESTMCGYYCHPVVATVCEGNCLRPDAPEFPFVIPTMLWRWSHLSTILAPLITMVVAFVRLIAQLLGIWDGYVDDIPRPINLSGDIRIHGNRVKDFPVAAPSVGSHRQWEGQAQKHSQESVPGLNLGRASTGSLDEDPSLDDDEYL